MTKNTEKRAKTGIPYGTRSPWSAVAMIPQGGRGDAALFQGDKRSAAPFYTDAAASPAPAGSLSASKQSGAAPAFAGLSPHSKTIVPPSAKKWIKNGQKRPKKPEIAQKSPKFVKKGSKTRKNSRERAQKNENFKGLIPRGARFIFSRFAKKSEHFAADAEGADFALKFEDNTVVMDRYELDALDALSAGNDLAVDDGESFG